jgi:ADP-dependent NAD(P)H-hydrate dehydratase / NAD(P)H-hydrate epimerase
MSSDMGLSVQEIRELEEKAVEAGLDERTLIENASSNLAKIIEELHLGKKVLAAAGKGNNGADVLAALRKLYSRGYDIKIAVVAEQSLNKEVAGQLDILEKLGAQINLINANSSAEFKKLAQDRDFILDGILGIGVKGAISPFIQRVIGMINQSGKVVVACDIPSGLSPDDGIILGDAVRASYTVTFLGPKKGFFINNGPECCGKIFVTDIGVSREILESRPKTTGHSSRS